MSWCNESLKATISPLSVQFVQQSLLPVCTAYPACPERLHLSLSKGLS